jgi:splicing factor U2AF subunit
LARKRRLTQWDIKPPGYENVTAEQAKLSGMFPLPGAPRTQAMDPTKLQAFMAQPGAIAEETALKPSQARQSKRLFIYNISPSITAESMMGFFNLQLNGLNIISGNDPTQSAMISDDKTYAMLEFRQPEDATVALALDGIDMGESYNGSSNGAAKGLSIKRPADYIVPTVEEEAADPAGVSSRVPDSPNKLCISNIPAYISDDQLLELLRTMGTLKAFVMAKDTSTEQPRVSSWHLNREGFN